MKTVAAIQTATAAKLELVELELPDPGPDQVTVKVLSSGCLLYTSDAADE